MIPDRHRSEGDGSSYKGHCLTLAVALTLTVLAAFGAGGYALWSVTT